MVDSKVVDVEKIESLKKALREAGLEFVVTRTDGRVAHVNVWVGE
jgi:hypothetical protein